MRINMHVRHFMYAFFAVVGGVAHGARSDSPYLMTTIMPTPETAISLGRACAISGERVIMAAGGSPYGNDVVIVRFGDSGAFVTEASIQLAGNSPGWSVDISGDLAVVGIPEASWPNTSSIGIGKVLVYRHEQGAWILEATIGPMSLPSGTAWLLGASVALDGDTLAVSDVGFDVVQNRVHIFRRDRAGTWVFESKVVSESTPIPYIALDGATLAVTGWSRHHMFRREGNAWVPDGQAGPNLVYSQRAAVLGDTLVAPDNNKNIVIFHRVAPGVWEVSETLSPQVPTIAPSDFMRAAISDSTIVAGPWESNEGNFETGVFWRRSIDGSWEWGGVFPNSDTCTTSQMFNEFAIDGDFVVTGSATGCGGYGLPEGYTHIFDLTPADCDSDGLADIDSDSDGVADCTDSDDDNDGTLDSLDGCPFDPLKVSAGQCGCGLPEGDVDADGVCDVVDNCPVLANPLQADCDGDGVGDACAIAAGVPDANGNGIPDSCDSAACPGDVNVDGVVNAADLAVVLGFWGPVGTFPAADIDGSGTVDAGDLAILLGGWGRCP